MKQWREPQISDRVRVRMQDCETGLEHWHWAVVRGDQDGDATLAWKKFLFLRLETSDLEVEYLLDVRVVPHKSNRSESGSRPYWCWPEEEE